MVNRKPFDPGLHDKYDQPGKDWVKSYIERNWGCTVAEFGQYDIDLIAIRDGKVVGYIEVEVRDWGGDSCPFSTIHVPHRKAYTLERYPDTVFFAVCNTMDAGYWVKAETILSSPVVDSPNKLMQGEKFFDVKHLDFNYVRHKT